MIIKKIDNLIQEINPLMTQLISGAIISGVFSGISSLVRYIKSIDRLKKQNQELKLKLNQEKDPNKKMKLNDKIKLNELKIKEYQDNLNFKHQELIDKIKLNEKTLQNLKRLPPNKTNKEKIENLQQQILDQKKVAANLGVYV